MDVIARSPDCDVVSAFSQVKLEDAPRLLKIPKTECPVVRIRLPRHKWPKSWETLKIPWCLLNETCTVTHSLNCYEKDNSKKLYWKLVVKKYQIGNVFLFIENNDSSHRHTWTTSKWLERSRIWLPCGKMMKNVDIDKTHIIS